jgi:hypothetical protein
MLFRLSFLFFLRDSDGIDGSTAHDIRHRFDTPGALGTVYIEIGRAHTDCIKDNNSF